MRSRARSTRWPEAASATASTAGSSATPRRASGCAPTPRRCSRTRWGWCACSSRPQPRSIAPTGLTSPATRLPLSTRRWPTSPTVASLPARPPTRGSIRCRRRRCAVPSRRHTSTGRSSRIGRRRRPRYGSWLASDWAIRRCQSLEAAHWIAPWSRRIDRARGWRTTWTSAPASAACSPTRCTPPARCSTCTRPPPTRRGR